MEYEIDIEVKYTTLQIISILAWNEMSKNQQKDTDPNPPSGDGEWARKSLFKNYFLLTEVKILENWYNSSWSLYGVKSRDYKVKKLKVLVKWETPGEIWTLLRPLLNNNFIYFLSKLIKNSKHIRLKYAQKCSESTFGSAYF